MPESSKATLASQVLISFIDVLSTMIVDPAKVRKELEVGEVVIDTVAEPGVYAGRVTVQPLLKAKKVKSSKA